MFVPSELLNLVSFQIIQPEFGSPCKLILFGFILYCSGHPKTD
uniref:Uncharacterized protein n=1 Tax=Rhizophora mucronata TaxID=61149 RepID=A0A2P2P2W6_RHIMU